MSDWPAKQTQVAFPTLTVGQAAPPARFASALPRPARAGGSSSREQTCAARTALPFLPAGVTGEALTSAGFAGPGSQMASHPAGLVTQQEGQRPRGRQSSRHRKCQVGRGRATDPQGWGRVACSPSRPRVQGGTSCFLAPQAETAGPEVLVPKRGSRQGTGVLHWITKCGRCLGSSRRRVEARLLRTQDSPGWPRGAQATHRAASSARLRRGSRTHPRTAWKGLGVCRVVGPLPFDVQ